MKNLPIEPPPITTPCQAQVPPDRGLGVCLVQAYRAPTYIRGASLKAALQAVDSVSLALAMNRSAGLARYWEAIRDLKRMQRERKPDIFILVFRGHEIAWLVRRLTRNGIFVFDAMMSPYAAFTEEGKFGWIGRLFARLWRPLEHMALRNADAVLTDTTAHAAYYQSEFGIPAKKIIVVPVGAIAVDPGHRKPLPKDRSDPFRVLFYGSFLPLHGVDIIIAAAALLTDLPIHFAFIGGNKRDARKLLEARPREGAVRFTHRLWVPIERLLDEEIPAADLCLGGPFGNTPQSRRVITGKTHQALASGKAVVIGRINDEGGFIDKQNCLLVEQGNPIALAEAIRWAYDNRKELPALGSSGQDLHVQRYSSRVIGANLVDALSRLRHQRSTSTGA